VKKTDKNISAFKILYQVLLPLHMGFVATSLVFLVNPGWSIPFIRAEVTINHMLGIPQTDYIRGYFELIIPSILCAFCIWLLLFFLFKVLVSDKVVRTIAGFMILFAPPLFWFFVYQKVGWPFGWPYRGAPVEIAATGVCVVLLLNEQLVIPRWAIGTLLATHFVFWYCLPSGTLHMPDWDIPNYAGPIGSLLGFSSAIAWVLYVESSQLREASTAIDQTP